MKKHILYLLFSLLALPALAQTSGVQSTTLNLNGTNVTGKVRRIYADYPLNAAGNQKLIDDIVSGAVSVTLTSGSRAGEVIASFTTSPPSQGPSTGPSWITGLRYSHNGTTLTLQGAGQIGAVAFAKNPESAFTTTNPDGVTIVSGEFYGPGGVSSGIYDRQWQVNLTPTPLRITARQQDQATTKTYDFTPNVSAEEWTYLVGSPSAGPPPVDPLTPPDGTPPASVTTTIAYNRVVYIGNSILQHGGTGTNANPGGDFVVDASHPSRGMAATLPGKDFFRVLSAKVVSANAGAVNRRLSDFGAPEQDLSAATGPFLEGLLTDPDGPKFYREIQTRFALVQSWKPDLLYFRLGENVADWRIPEIGATEFKNRLKALLDKLIAGNASATVILSTSVWDRPNYDAAIRQIAAERGYAYADFQGMWAGRFTNGFYALGVYNDAGINDHPDDDGMAYIAAKLWEATPKTNVLVPPVPPSTTDLNFVAYADQGWSGDDMKFIQNGVIKAGFKRSVGGTLCYLADGDGENYINDLQLDGQSDKGRQGQFASNYRRPGNTFTTPGGAKTNLYGFDTGDNVVQGGSLYPFLSASTILASAIVTHPTKGQMLYYKVRPKFWSVPNEDGFSTDEVWCWLEGRALGYFTRHTILYPSGSQSDYQSMQQENPCVYVQANAWQQFVQLTPGGGDFERTITDGGVFSKTALAAGCWAGSYKPGGGKGVTIYTPGNANFTTGQFGQRAGGWNSNESAYVSASIERNYSNAGVYEDSGYIILGTMAQAKSTIATLPARSQNFDFDFTGTNIWSNKDSRVKRESNGNLTWYCGDGKTDRGQTSVIGNFMSPAGYYDTSGIPYLDIEMAVTGTSIMGLKFLKHGLLDAVGTEFRKTFPVIGDGVMRTYRVYTDHPDFKGYVASIGMEAPSGQMPQGAKAVIKRIKKP